MKTNEQKMKEQEAKDASWLELVVYLTDISYLDPEVISRYQQVFGTVTVAAAAEKPSNLPEHVNWAYADDEETQSENWNRFLRSAHQDWVLFIIDDEQIDLGHLPSKSDLSDGIWAPALIQYTKEENLLHFYQIRCVPARTGIDLFDGDEIPDCTRTMTSNDIQITESPILLVRGTHPYDHIDTDKELLIRNYSPQVYLVTGDRYIKARKYVHAAAQYRQLLKLDRLLPFDRLAAVNGLASCLTEQYKWEQALTLAEKSLESEPVQHLPYLIQFRIHQLNKHYKKAYEALRKYYEVQYYENLYMFPKANYEVSISREETILNLADLASKNGNLEQAFDYLEELYELKGENISTDILKQLLVLSIDLADHEKSVLYFHKIFGNPVPQTLSEEENVELNDYMDMFMKNKWYDLVYSVYSRLYVAHPKNDEYRRRLIVTLLKTNRIEQARDLATKVA